MTDKERDDIVLERVLKDVLDKLFECEAYSHDDEHNTIFSARCDLLEIRNAVFGRVHNALNRKN